MGLKMGEVFIILVALLLLFGGARLPQLGKSLGEAIRNFKRGFDGTDHDDPKKSQAMLAANAASENPAPSIQRERS